MTLSFSAPTVTTEASAPATRVQKSATQWTVGEKYIGFLVGTEIMHSRYGAAKVYVLKTANEFGELTGEELRIITSKSMEPQMAVVKENQAVMIECLGKIGASKAVQFKVLTSDTFLK